MRGEILAFGSKMLTEKCVDILDLLLLNGVFGKKIFGIIVTIF